MSWAISTDDPRAGDVRELLARHLAYARATTAPVDVHALDLDALLDPSVLQSLGARPMTFIGPRRLQTMTNITQTPTTLSNIGVAMFTVADQDAALAFYTEKLGFEVRGDSRFGEHDEMRWLEVAPPGSAARLALCPPMSSTPGGSMIGVDSTDVLGEHARLSTIGGIDLDPEPMRTPGAPLLFMLRDPDGNNVAVVEAPPAA